MSLGAYQRALARMVSEPAFRRHVLEQSALAFDGLHLSARERKRLVAFSRDPGMRVNTVLYRANRLAPILNALPRTCAALREQFGVIVHDYWSSSELKDLQFPNEVQRFVGFLRRWYGDRLRRTPGLEALLTLELAVFELLLLPRRTIRAEHSSDTPLEDHPLVRRVDVDVDPGGLIAVLEAGSPLESCAAGAGVVVVDHRLEPGTLHG